MAFQTFQQEYMQMPPITRAYTTSCLLTTVAVQLDIVTPFQLYFNPSLIFKHGQVWRLFTNFLFFGTIGFNFLFNMIFTYRYCRMLEEGSFRGRTADFLFMFLFGAVVMTIVGCSVQLVFYGQAFTIMLVYVWSRRNPYVRMNFFGLITFQAPYLPWVLLMFSLLLGNSIIVDIIGIGVGHIYYFLEDVFPRQPGGFKLLQTPKLLKLLVDPPTDEDQLYQPLAEDLGPPQAPAAPGGGDEVMDAAGPPIVRRRVPQPESVPAAGGQTTGAAGDTPSPAGASGINSTGSTGGAGPSGIKSTGSTGGAGPSGIKSTGSTGGAGPSGIKSTDSIGAAGPSGIKSTGSAGVAGPSGLNTSSRAREAGPNGINTSGSAGDPGPSGINASDSEGVPGFSSAKQKFAADGSGSPISRGSST